MIDPGSCSESEPFALRVVGDEMAPEFADGQIIIVDPGGMVSSGCYVVAKAADGMIFRQLIIENDAYCLRALDAAVPETRLENGLDDIVGVISQRAGKRRSEHKRYDTRRSR